MYRDSESDTGSEEVAVGGGSEGRRDQGARKRMRLEKNREAARLSRKRKKEYMSVLEEKVVGWRRRALHSSSR